MFYKLANNILSYGCLLILFCVSCNSYIKLTPFKYKYKSEIPSYHRYQEDSLYIMSSLNEMLKENIGPFAANKAYSINATTIYIDTILYSKDGKGLVVFIINRTDNDKIQHYGYDSLKYFYGANYLYGLKDSLSKEIKMFNYGAVRFINFSSYGKAKEALYEYCFERRATERPWNNREPSYNMDDVRFWNGEQFNSIRSDTAFIISGRILK